MHISCGLWVGLPGVAVSQRGSSLNVNCKASTSLFKPSGHTTMSLCCNSLHICSWWSQPWASTLGVPSVMVLTCHSLHRGTWDRATFSQMKAYAQSALSSTSSKSLWAASARVGYWAWWGCAHMATRPKTLSYPVVMLGVIKKNAMSCWGFSTPPCPPEKGC